ncbi:MAG: U32 family peptidase [Clostridia bacterium]|nr:U32 family peptidase [Clostridia bacterium]
MELLSPAGDRAALIAAVQNGADAVYFGARGFNARRSADNFEGDGLKEAVDYCHERGVKVYLTLNTMVRQDELGALEVTIRDIAQAGADAVIVQDLGVAEAVRRIAPHMELHASTQMAVHNRSGVRYLKEHGFTRAVLAREMDFDEIRDCAQEGIDLEVFAHGALCVSCSGQCLMSSLIGGRSGNRGMCAQPCRMKYKMDGKEGYLLSTRDLMTADIMQRFYDAGVTSVKLEGRLKRPEYVAIVTQVYRKAMDGIPVTPQDLHELKQIFNRGSFTRGYGAGIEESSLMFHERPNHAGVLMGKCEKTGIVILEADADISDLIVLRGTGEDIPVKISGKKGQRISCKKAEKGMLLYCLVSEKQMNTARATWQEERRARHVNALLSLKIGEPALLTVWDDTHCVSTEGSVVQTAENRPLDQARAEAQLRKTGGTVYVLDDVRIEADESAYLPISELNNLRRDALAKLREQTLPKAPTPGHIGDTYFPNAETIVPTLRIQSSNIAALQYGLKNGADDIVYSPFDMHKLDEALLLPPFYLAVPQVMRDEELLSLNKWASRHADKIKGVYLSNIGQFAYPWPGTVTADAGMNIANNLSLQQLSIDAYSPSVELTARQIQNLGGKKDLIVHGYLPLMQLRHCPNRAIKGLKGKHSSCTLCDQKNAPPLPHLEDRTGARFRLRRLAYKSGCVLQLLNSVPLMLLRKADKLPASHVWRILADDMQEAEAIKLYRAYLDGSDYTRLPEWDKVSHTPSTTGHYFRGVE